jgi:hypothetical protein
MTQLVRRCLSREPGLEEASELQTFLNNQKQRFAGGGVDPWPLLTADDAEKEKVAKLIPAGTTPADMAAWTALARVVLNLDETITKE